jgi:opacity protein-like surface antigen
MSKKYTKQVKPIGVLLVACSLTAIENVAAEDMWYAGVTAGFTETGVSSLFTELDGLNGRAKVSASSGFTTGAVLGREFDDRWRLEGEFRYRTNALDSVNLSTGERISDGDFSSGALGVNAYWLFGDDSARWRPFVGAGLAWMQEIDIDLESDPVNGSYSGDGTAWQLMGGVNWAFNERWSLDLEARYLDAGSIRMVAEKDALAGNVIADYAIFELTADLIWRF